MSHSLFNGFPLPGDETTDWLAGQKADVHGMQALERYLTSVPSLNSGERDVLNDQRLAVPFLFGNAYGGGAAVRANVIYLQPITFDRDVCVDAFYVNVTAGSAGKRFVVGVYEADHDIDDLYPGALVACSGEQSAASTTVVKAYVCFTLKANTLYWVAFTCDGTASYQDSVAANRPNFGGLDRAMGTSSGTLWKVAWTYASNLPGVFPTGATVFTSVLAEVWPVVGLEVAA